MIMPGSRAGLPQTPGPVSGRRGTLVLRTVLATGMAAPIERRPAAVEVLKGSTGDPATRAGQVGKLKQRDGRRGAGWRAERIADGSEAEAIGALRAVTGGGAAARAGDSAHVGGRGRVRPGCSQARDPACPFHDHGWSMRSRLALGAN